MWARTGRGTLCGVALGFLPLLGGCFLLEEEEKGARDGAVGGTDEGSSTDAAGGPVDADGDGHAEDDDCDDADADVFPGADERCNGVDDDCDGEVDEWGAVDAPGWFYDADEDGFGDPEQVTYACTAPPAHVDNPRDCDDRSAAVNPDAQEVCDGLDNDCDGDVDSDDDSLGGDAADWFRDGDGDGYGDPASVVIACTRPDGVVSQGGDCDDGDPDTYPGAPERCDGSDNDCDDRVDEDPVGEGQDYYADGDGDGFGDDGDVVRACAAVSGRVTRGGDCDDGNTGVNPDATEICADGLDNDCDGLALGCLLEGDLSLASDADLTLIGEDLYDYAATSIALVPDVTGDGVPDVAVGAPGDDRGGAGAGAVYIVDGGQTGSLSLASAAAIVVGESSSDAAGTAVAGIGDVDGDGYGDLLVGAPYRDRPTETDAGGAWLLLGPLTGWTGMRSGELVALGEGTTDYAGSVVAPAGDASGDGVADLLVGAPGHDDIGAAYVVDGSLSGRLALDVAGVRLLGEGSRDLAGGAVSGGGDLDGDGVADVVVGARNHDATAAEAGAAYAVFGPVTSDMNLASADLVLYGENANDGAGIAVLVAPDLTGDGLGDVAVGARGYDTPNTGAGVAYVVAGGTTGTLSLANADARLTGRVGLENLGGFLCDGGDADGDGFADLLVGAEGHDGGRGAVYLYAGPLSGTIAGSSATARIRGAASGDRAGACGGAQDVDGDGLDDVLVGAYGSDAGGNYAGGAWLLRPEAL